MAMINKTFITPMASAALLALVLGLTGMAQAQAQAALKIGVVNAAQLMQDSPQARVAQRALEDEFAPRRRELENLQKEYQAREEKLKRDAAVMSETERTRQERELLASRRDLERSVQDFQQDVELRQNEEGRKMNAALLTEIQSYAKAQGYDVILSDGVLFAKDSLNITSAVLAALESRAGAAAPKPAAK
jgi:outer membrane protein